MSISLADQYYNFSDLKFSGTFQQNQPVSDGSGGTVDNFVNVLVTRVGLQKRSGKLSNGAGVLEYWKDYILICRYQIAITGIGTDGNPVLTADSRWIVNNEVYKIQDWEQIDMNPFMYKFTVTKNQ